MLSGPHREGKLKILSICFWLALWQLAASLANARLLIPLPTPVSTLQAFIALSSHPAFWLTVAASLLRISLGFLSALILGTLCALISARFSFFRILTAPLLQLIRAIPVASFTILVFLWVSREHIPSLISFLTVFPIVWANMESGIRSVDKRLLELARVYGMKKGSIRRKIILPGVRPFFASSLASGIGFAWKSGVAAEIICRSSNSIGDLLWSSKSIIAYDEVFAETLLIVILSVCLLKLTARLTRSAPAARRDSDAALTTAALDDSATADPATADSASVDSANADPATVASALADSAASHLADPKAPSILLDHIDLHYEHAARLFQDYSLSIPAGSRICLSGPSGIGKSSLIRLILGLEKADAGRILIQGEVSYSVVFQEDLLLPHLTILQNVLLFAPGEETRALKLLTALGLEEALGALPSALSGGMKRRAALARALCHPFDILLLDEPFTGLDEGSKALCISAVKGALKDPQKILILASHDKAEAAALTSKTICLPKK